MGDSTALRLRLLLLALAWLAPLPLHAEDDEVAVEEEAAAAPDEAAVTEEAPAEEAPAADPAPAESAPPPAADEPAEEAAPAAAESAPAAASAAPAEESPSPETTAAEAPAAEVAPPMQPESPAPTGEPAVTDASAAAEPAGETTELMDEPEATAPLESAAAEAPVTLVHPVAEPGPEPSAAAELEVSLDEDSPAEAASAPAAVDSEVEIDAPPQGSTVPSLTESSEPIPSQSWTLPPAEPEAPAKAIVWSTKPSAKAFDDFMKSGVPLSPGPVHFTAAVTSRAVDDFSLTATHEDVLVDGVYPRGAMFAVYRVLPAACSARYVGVIAIRKPVGGGRSRGTVVRASDAVQRGDSLVPLDALREEFDRQQSRLSSMPSVEANVSCFASGGSVGSSLQDAVILNRGSVEGVGLGWFCEFLMPGKDRNLSYGRVVRVGPHACTVLMMRLYEPVQVGDRARLSAGVPAAGAKATRR